MKKFAKIPLTKIVCHVDSTVLLVTVFVNASSISGVIIFDHTIMPKNTKAPKIFPIKQTVNNHSALFKLIVLKNKATVTNIKLLVNNSECVSTINTKPKLNANAPIKLTTPGRLPANCVLIPSIKIVQIASKNPDIIAFTRYLENDLYNIVSFIATDPTMPSTVSRVENESATVLFGF